MKGVRNIYSHRFFEIAAVETGQGKKQAGESQNQAEIRSQRQRTNE